jgi:hypothetical protein
MKAKQTYKVVTPQGLDVDPKSYSDKLGEFYENLTGERNHRKHECFPFPNQGTIKIADEETSTIVELREFNKSKTKLSLLEYNASLGGRFKLKELRCQ